MKTNIKLAVVPKFRGGDTVHSCCILAPICAWSARVIYVSTEKTSSLHSQIVEQVLQIVVIFLENEVDFLLDQRQVRDEVHQFERPIFMQWNDGALLFSLPVLDFVHGPLERRTREGQVALLVVSYLVLASFLEVSSGCS